MNVKVNGVPMCTRRTNTSVDLRVGQLVTRPCRREVWECKHQCTKAPRLHDHLSTRDTRPNHTTTGLALWSSLTLETRSHPWVPAGHPQYTGAHNDGKAMDGPIPPQRLTNPLCTLTVLLLFLNFFFVFFLFFSVPSDRPTGHQIRLWRGLLCVDKRCLSVCCLRDDSVGRRIDGSSWGGCARRAVPVAMSRGEIRNYAVHLVVPL